MKPSLKNIYSSYVQSIGYDDASEQLYVKYQKDNRMTVYQNVPPDKAYSVMNAPSIGEALHNMIRNQYHFRYEESNV